MKNLFSNAKGDFLGGITAGIVALPLALAFGVSSGLGPSAGLYGAIFLSFFAALFGGTSTQISGPTAPMTAVSMVIIVDIIAASDGDVNKALPSILIVFILAGLMQIGLGILSLGKYINYIPYPVVSGFMTAIGIIILITQISPTIGYYPKEDAAYVNQFKPLAEEVMLEKILREEVDEGTLVLEDFKETISRAENITQAQILEESQTLASKEASGVIGTIKTLPRALKKINWLELMLTISTVFVIYGFKRITKSIPSILVALIVISSVAVVFGLDYKPIQQIPVGLPTPNLSVFSEFDFEILLSSFPTALTLALLGSIDSLLTSVVADNMTKTKHKPNKELVGQGIGNSIAAIFGGIPGAGATIRTVVNINSGGKTKLSGMIAGVMLLFILLALGPAVSEIPAAVLSGILITVGIGVIDYKGLKAIPNLPVDTKVGPLKLSSEVLVMLVVLVLASVWNLVYAVGIGLAIASLIFVKKVGDLAGERSNVKPLKKGKRWEDETNFPDSLKKKVFIKHIKGPFFFGSAENFQLLAKEIPSEAHTVIIRMSRMPYIDQSGLYALEDILIDLKRKECNVFLVGVLEQPRYMLDRIHIIPDLIPNKHVFSTFNDCVKWIKTSSLHKDRS